MSNFDDQKDQIDNNISENLTNTGKETLKTGGKIAYKGAKKIGTAAGRKMFSRGFLKKSGAMIAKGGKVVATGLLNIGKFIIIGIKMFLAALISWAWIIIPICLIIVIIWWLMPATKHFTLDGINKDIGTGETTHTLSTENKALENYYKFYSDRVLSDNKVKISYKDIDDTKTGTSLFKELNEEEYIIGPFKPNKIVPPENISPSTGTPVDPSNPSLGNTPNTGDYVIPKIEDIITVQWFKGGENTLKIPKLSGNKLTSEQIEEYKFLVYDINSGKTFYLVRTMGANHNDVEYATEADALIMKEALEKEPLDYKGRKAFESWVVRPAFVIQGNKAIIATWTTLNHAGNDKNPGLKFSTNLSGGYPDGPNYDNILNGIDGHMDLYFHGGIGHKNPNKNYHKEPLAKLEKEVMADKQKYIDLLNSQNGINIQQRTSTDTNKQSRTSTDTNNTNSTNTNNTNSTNTNTSNSDNSKITIMIDPGHGGIDPGASGNGIKEKDINLQVSLKVRDNLKALGYNIIMSRETDKTLIYGIQRTKVSNDYADICISIHCNSGAGTSGEGIETFYGTGKDSTLATHIQTQVIKETNAINRGVKPSSETKRKKIGILDNNKKKAALIELGFINNPNEATKLKDGSYQDKLVKGIVNGIQSYYNNTPIDEIINSVPGNTQTSNDIYNIVDEMEGFISTSKDTITDKEEIKKETIDKMESYWENKAKPTLGLDWIDKDTKKDMNKIINDSYSIKEFEEIKQKNKIYNFDLEDDEKKNIKDKYGREEYFRMSPEFLHSLNQHLYKDKFIHTESLIKPVKINEKNMELDFNAFTENSSLKTSDKLEYGLGTVFVYRPVITFKVEKGVDINQVEVTKTDINGNIIYDSKATGSVINNYDAKIDYVLERAITFSGEFIFTYEEEVNLINQENIEEINYDSSKGIATGRLRQSKTYEVTEVPKNITFNDKGRTYIYNYLSAFTAKIPAEIINHFNKGRLYDAFKYFENPETELVSEDGENQEPTTPSGGSGVDSVEQWRDLCEEIGPKWGVDPNILMAFIHTESTGNPHTSNGNYGGLTAMKVGGSEDINYYFKNDPEFKNYTGKDIFPSCSGGTHNEAEHQRVARYCIEYTARRFSAQMGLMLYSIYGIDYRTTILSDSQIQTAALFSFAGYQTGEYGQMTIFDNYKDDPQLYSSPGTYYTSIFLKHYNGNCDCHSKGTSITSNKKNTAKGYLTTGCSNKTYLEKGYTHYAYYSEDGSSIDKSVENYKYEQQKWFVHQGMPNKPGSGGGDPNNGVPNNGGSDENTTEESVKYDMTLALNYAEYEKTGWLKNDDRYTVSLDEQQIELMLANATAMREQLTVNEVEEGNYAFWDRDFLKDNFENGLPKGRTIKDYRNTLFSDKNWKKILDIVDYFNKQKEADYIQNVTPFTSSNLIGHAYRIYANISLQRTPKGIADGVTNKVDDLNNVTLGDILILRPMNLHDSDFNIVYPTETAICIGEDEFAMIRRKKVNSYSLESIQNEYDILEVVRPLNTKKKQNSSNNTNTNPSDGTTNPHPIGTWLWPVLNPKLPSGLGVYGMRDKHPIYGTRKMHHGIDLSPLKKGTDGDPIFASRDGVVESVVNNIPGFKYGSYGNQVVIKHSDGYMTRYAHLAYKMVYVKKGDTVKQGDVIGGMGNTGGSKGSHLHFEIRKPDGSSVDPMDYLTKPTEQS